MTNEKRKVLDRIRKVMAKAEGTDNPDEAEIFMAKVHAMLEEHNISMVELGTEDTEDPVGINEDIAKYRVNDSWMQRLSYAVARYYGCETVCSNVNDTKHTWQISVAGRESARVTFELMLPYVKKSVMAKARQSVADGYHRNTRIAARRIANALVTRIWVIIRENQEKEERIQGNGRSLVPVDLIDLVMRERWPNLVSSRASITYTDKAATKAASDISLARQTGGDTVRRIGE